MLVKTDLQSCIAECTRCNVVCTTTIQYCLTKGGKHAATEHIRLLQDCAEICLTAREFMLRGSDMHAAVCGVCAEVCDRCVRRCEQVAGSGDSRINECVEACRECARSCHEMALQRH